ncbi:unnamed protein product, partial [Allacma fusca]
VRRNKKYNNSERIVCHLEDIAEVPKWPSTEQKHARVDHFASSATKCYQMAGVRTFNKLVVGDKQCVPPCGKYEEREAAVGEDGERREEVQSMLWHGRFTEEMLEVERLYGLLP